MSYLGPFNGHVNGALVMKELHKPWPHWHTDNHSLVSNMPQRLKNRFKTAPYLTDQSTGSVFSLVKSAESLESIVEKGISKWYSTRKSLDFLDSGNRLRSNPSNVRRWMAHLLLNTTINIAVAQTIGQKWRAPANHFYNREMFSQYSATDLLKDIEIPKFEFSKTDYLQASENLGLAVIQDVREVPADHQGLHLPEGTLGGGKQTSSFEKTLFVQVQGRELEDMMFTILQPSFEDAQGVLIMQNIKSNPGKAPTSLLSPKVFNALMMLDFWNSIYSWRRAVLMQYVPMSTVYNETTGKYELEDQFIANVKNSKFYLDEDPEVRNASPEYQFISLLDTELETHRARIRQYMHSVDARLKTVEGLIDYIRLAESRRLIYRPLPLDEFALTIPYALKYGLDFNSRYEMTEAGDIQTLPGRGSKFFQSWTRTQDGWSLAGYDPHLIPKPDGLDEDSPSPTNPPAAASRSIRSAQTKTTRCPYREVWPEI
ncbi:uncharacterized protein Z519_11762 [Cladophialophora bantiana CBS 173.52]|uniref:Uncharacterized protein n=1 Tax=Cladophialophora bantiana (strain ATCC 10958 / CBS 173.52 / CDC B-1940 / NIH 8579) TaxID=1442370 RepID=A0A0D2H387_CLAB1|nr:uncharacterized protein Z519_11762 [Cladophialophora bantiana CBS 173.52]KIW87788.1 hypothetical protein Z519_11762 [Cladophialophora bantiana CBS 173.52]